MPQPAPLHNIPIGQPWQVIATDILQVLLSTNNNHYLVVIQDYFTKWADAIPIPDQTASCITSELIKFFSTYGPLQILHSDQGRNFESTIFTQTLDAFGIQKSRTTPYHPQGDGMVERFNRTLLQLLRAYVAIGKPTCLMFCIHIAHLNTLPPEFHHSFCYMVDIQHLAHWQHN